MIKKKVVIINTGPFPEGDAGAVRLRFVAQALVEAGFSVEVLCRGKANDEGFIEGIYYKSLKRSEGSRIFRGIDYYCFLGRAKQYLRKNRDIDCIYIYNAQISVFEYCKKLHKKRGICLVHDCVEWYSPDEFINGEKNIAYKNNNKINTKTVDNSYRVIAISRFLQKHFTDRGIATMRLPILCDSRLRMVPKQSSEKLTLFYAGVPFRKDYVGNVLKAALLLTPEEREQLRVILVGTTKGYLIHHSDIPEEVIEASKDFLEIYPRMPRQEVLQHMEMADFTILPRDASRRYAQAGFPSKVVESLANATPVLCNYSSDLELYLQDGENALIAKDHTPEELAKTIHRAIKLTASEKIEMSKNALKSAADYFDYRLYINELKSFIENS